MPPRKSIFRDVQESQRTGKRRRCRDSHFLATMSDTQADLVAFRASWKYPGEEDSETRAEAMQDWATPAQQGQEIRRTYWQQFPANQRPHSVRRYTPPTEHDPQRRNTDLETVYGNQLRLLKLMVGSCMIRFDCEETEAKMNVNDLVDSLLEETSAGLREKRDIKDWARKV
jgi:hypothetical protein